MDKREFHLIHEKVGECPALISMLRSHTEGETFTLGDKTYRRGSGNLTVPGRYLVVEENKRTYLLPDGRIDWSRDDEPFTRVESVHSDGCVLHRATIGGYALGIATLAPAPEGREGAAYTVIAEEVIG